MSNTAVAKSDMCHGPLAKKMIIFTLPLMASSMLQLLFNAADVVVVGRFAGSESLAAVSSTTPLINLIINLFIGLSVGANVAVAHDIGAGDKSAVSDTVRTSVLMGAISGIVLLFFGILISGYALELMQTPDDVIGAAAVYLRIYFLGMPALMIYNFGAAVLNAGGDTKRPFWYLTIGGIINIILNIFFVVVCRWGVAGVAVATVISEIVSAVLVIRCLIKNKGMLKLKPSLLKMKKKDVVRILKVGVPAGLQGIVSAFSHLILQSAINSFGTVAMAASAAASNIEGIVNIAMYSFSRTALTYVSQNMGAHEYKRVNRIFWLCMLYTAGIGVLLGSLALVFGRQLLGIFSTEPQIIEEGLLRMRYICGTYALCGLMDCTAGALRGMGYSLMPTLVSFVGVCGIRITWVFTVFKRFHSTSVLFACYPISWAVTFTVLLIGFIVLFGKIKSEKLCRHN